MPEYEYKCQDCGEQFTVRESVSHREELDRQHEIHCPKCNGTQVKRMIEPVFVTTSRKS